MDLPPTSLSSEAPMPMRRLYRLISCLLLAVVTCLPTSFAATLGVIGHLSRQDFDACYLTTEDPLERNLATLLRGLQVEVLGRATNGRWKVGILSMQNSRVIQHEGWPGSSPAIGWVNPEFLIFPGGSPPAVAAPAPSTLAGGGGSGVFGVPGSGSGSGSGLGGASATGGRSATAAGPSVLPSSGGLTGSDFLTQTAGLSPAAREDAILQAVIAGHMPAFLGNFATVQLTATGPSGAQHQAEIRVTPAYLSIGTDADFVRIPMTPATAQQAADHLGCSLPYPKMVDAIWSQAANQLTPRPLTPGPSMGSNEYYGRANALVNEELAGRSPGELTAGSKKDIVLANRLQQFPGRVAIYGWHRTNGRPIQSLSTVHGRTYVDYSHGARLIANDLVVDGAPTTLAAVLANPELAGLLSSDLPVTVTRYP